MAVVVLGEMIFVGMVASRWAWLSLSGVRGLRGRGPLTLQAVVFLGMRPVFFVAVDFFHKVGLLTPTP